MMNFTIGTATQSWKSQKVRQAIQIAAVGGFLTTTALLAGGVFEGSSPAPSASTVESPIGAPVESRASDALVYFLVDTEVEAARLEGANSSEQALMDPGRVFPTSEYIVVNNPASERAADTLLAAGWATEIAANVQVIDQRSNAKRQP